MKGTRGREGVRVLSRMVHESERESERGDIGEHILEL